MSCCLDAPATAAKANLDLDIGDKYDTHTYMFRAKERGDNQGAGWPSTTGNPSGGGRTNNPPTPVA